MKDANLSLVIPCYNEQAYLPACLSAIIPQLLPGDELIVVDNNSTDKTSQLATKYGAKVIQEQRQGQVFAQDTGFKTAINQFLVRLDADTILPGDWLARVRQHFAQGALAVSGPARPRDVQFQRLSQFMVHLSFYSFRLIIGGFPMFGSAYAIRKTTWQTCQPGLHRLPNIWEDMELGIVLHKLGLQVVYDKQLVASVSARNVVGVSYWRAVGYQLYAPRTLAVNRMYFRACMSFIERLLVVIVATPIILIEHLLNKTKPSHKQTKGRL
ncbi:glycosyltransferase family 2 protein [Candidatus Saccharibacteria bacterium]|nr:glycosyltransferase family 2 protein [Candidatus Saccharibacteria bacterium]MCB9821434.1 glycosyltransferase family 2 protein [Candidatus Nomurabacteria bacterium]